MEKESGLIGPESSEEAIRTIDGKKYRRVDSGYTIRQYFSHSTPEKGPGPGWDTRMSLLDDKWAMENFGKTFTTKEVFDPSKLPDLPYYTWELVEER